MRQFFSKLRHITPAVLFFRYRGEIVALCLAVLAALMILVWYLFFVASEDILVHDIALPVTARDIEAINHIEHFLKTHPKTLEKIPQPEYPDPFKDR